jgi:hypothetical protein
MRSRREEFRKASDSVRRDLDRWLVGRVPDRSRLCDWEHVDWFDAALPPKSADSCQRFPATVMYHCMCVLTGDEDSAPVVASAVDLAPALVLETVAFLMGALQRGLRIHAPRLIVDDAADEAESAQPIPTPSLPELTTMTGSVVEVHDRIVTLTPGGPVAIPLIRLSQRNKALALVQAVPNDVHFVVHVPLDISGKVTLSVASAELGPVAGGIDVELGAATATPAPHVRTVGDPSRLNDVRLDVLLDRISTILDRGGLASTEIDELFDDERSGAEALLRLPDRWPSTRAIEQACLAALPAALMFDDLGVTGLIAARRAPRVLRALVGSRTPSTWSTLGWPNQAHFEFDDDLIGFALKLARQSEPITHPTRRYVLSHQYPNPQQVDRVVERMSGSISDQSFVDLVVATHRALTVDSVVPEATRMLLDVHRRQPDPAINAVLVGISLFLATRTTHKDR